MNNADDAPDCLGKVKEKTARINVKKIQTRIHKCLNSHKVSDPRPVLWKKEM